jgi:hypothetical protein
MNGPYGHGHSAMGSSGGGFGVPGAQPGQVVHPPASQVQLWARHPRAPPWPRGVASAAECVAAA